MIKVSLPNEIRIGDTTYKIIFDNKHGKFTGYAASTSHREGEEEIVIDNNLSGAQLTDAILHESFHIIGRIYSLTLEETPVCCLTQGIAQLLTQLGIEFSKQGKSKGRRDNKPET